MKTAIVIGATTGIGRDLAKKLCQDGYRVVVTGRRATSQIIKAVKRKKKVVYITKRWNLVAFLWHILPDWIYFKIV
ncbi:MAG: SDR family NAD(P)-dependent oxidoreductase [Planctomycetaceae bacterium]|jgi:short-subunit dehydrogenase|nr:SDR family NAD(P)-dependent oxidoreductase [Planctomycetaceae bacterium]